MKTPEIAEHLKRTSLFECLSNNEVTAIAERASVREVKKDEWVFHQGDPSNEMFVAAKGSFRLAIDEAKTGIEKELVDIPEGMHFGEVALLESGGRGGSVQARENGQLIVLPRQAVLDAIRRTPELGLALCRGFVRYVRLARDAFLSLPFADIEDTASLAATVHLLPPRISIACQALVLEKDGKRLKVGMVNPYDRMVREFVQEVLSENRVEFVGISRSVFDRAAEAYLGSALGASASLSPDDELHYIDSEGAAVQFGDDEEGGILSEVFGRAVASGASDIHLEPKGRNHEIRMRLDGAMFVLHKAIAANQYRRLVARVKAMSDLDVTNQRTPEDGRFLLVAGSNQIEIRVASTPVLGGVKLALRLIDPARSKRELQSLFLNQEVEQLARDVLVNPSGLALVVGPTGAGKTATLYATLNALWRSSKTINVMTVEDPVEFELPFANQLQVNRAVGMTFEKSLRSILRQDPDVILVGEIRDPESATIATEASVTGHLVLSSLHADSATEAIVSLRRFGVPPYMMSSSLRGVVSQRLLPRVCNYCAAPAHADDEAVAIARRIGVLQEGFKDTIRRGRGCERCQHTGRAGRVAVFELLSIEDSLRPLLESNAGASEIRSNLTSKTFLPLEHYAGMLLLSGVISPEDTVSLFPKVRYR